MAIPVKLATSFAEYKVIRQIGQGGSGIVCLIEDDEAQPFAAKLIANPYLTPSRKKRFKNEIRFGLTINHPNIVTIVDNGVVTIGGTETPFYVMPLYPGTLRTKMQAGVAPEEAVALFDQILEGLEAAHANGVWHRDIKPENVLYDPNRNQLVLADFGIAHFAEEALHTFVETHAGERMANFAYAAPEQRRRDGQVDHRSDIYAMGMILNELFTKEAPYGQGYKLVGDVNKSFAFIDDLVRAMLQADPARRLQSVQGVKQDLKIRAELAGSVVRMAQLSHTDATSPSESDPLIVNPVHIVDTTYDQGRLRLRLSQGVNQKWQRAFNNAGSRQFLGYEAARAEFRAVDMPTRSHMTITIGLAEEIWFPAPPENLVQSVLETIDGFVETANREYGRTVVAERAEAIREAEASRRRALEEEQRKSAMLEAIAARNRVRGQS